jgi:hypothetical protein
MFPKIKKDLKEFVHNEDGRITQESLIRMGVVSIGALGAAVSINAIEIDPFEKIEIVDYDCAGSPQMHLLCKDVIEVGGGDVEMIVKPAGLSQDGDMGMGDIGIDVCEDAVSAIRGKMKDKWESAGDGGLEKTNIVSNLDCPSQISAHPGNNDGGTDYPSRFFMSLGSECVPPTLHHHGNSLKLGSVSDKIVGSHEHAVAVGCKVQGTLTFNHEYCDGIDRDLEWADAVVTFVYDDGTNPAQQIDSCTNTII